MGYKSKKEKLKPWHKTFCRMCGDITKEVVLGHVHRITMKSGNHWYCKAGALEKILKKKKITLSKIKSRAKVKIGEAVPAVGYCENCHVKIKEVKAGGVFIECAECKDTGVLTAKSKQAKYYRVRDSVLAPNLLTVKFKKCEEHEASNVPRIEV